MTMYLQVLLVYIFVSVTSTKCDTPYRQIIKLPICSLISPTHSPHGSSRTVSKVRVFCNQDPIYGHYLKVQWVPAPYIKSRYVEWYQISIFDRLAGEMMCFNVSKTESDASFFLEDGIKLGISYYIGVAAYPTGPKTDTDGIQVRCESYGIATTSTPSTTVTTKPLTAYSTVALHKNKDGDDLRVIIIPIVAAVVVLVTILVIIWYWKTKNTSSDIVHLKKEKSVYVSHYTEGKKDEERLLKLVSNLCTFGLNVFIDLCNQVAINNAGGIPHWSPEKISSVDKILLVITPMYLKALSSINEKDEIRQQEICKVNMEFNYIRTLMYSNCHQIPQLVVMLDGVKQADIPSMLQGRFLCQFPKHFHGDDNNFNTLMGLLLDIEPIQISFEEKDTRLSISTSDFQNEILAYNDQRC